MNHVKQQQLLHHHHDCCSCILADVIMIYRCTLQLSFVFPTWQVKFFLQLFHEKLDSVIHALSTQVYINRCAFLNGKNDELVCRICFLAVMTQLLFEHFQHLIPNTNPSNPRIHHHHNMFDFMFLFSASLLRYFKPSCGAMTHDIEL